MLPCKSVFQEGPETLENTEDLEIMPWGAGELCHGGLEDIHGGLCHGVWRPFMGDNAMGVWKTSMETMPGGSWRTSSGDYARGVMEDILWTLCQGGHGGHPLARGVMEDILWKVMPWTILGGGWKFGRC